VDYNTQKQYGRVCTKMILFNIGLALKNFGDFQWPVSSTLRQAAEEYVRTLGSDETKKDQASQKFLYQLFTQERGGCTQ
jgi:hypothetical protein